MSIGACKICQSEYAKQFTARLKRGDSLMKVVAWSQQIGYPVTKPTVLKHRRHITDPKTTAVEQARKNPAIKRVNHDEFLQTLVDIGAATASNAPEIVTMDQSIRAAQTLAQKSDKKVDFLLVLAERLMPKQEMIEGEWEELDSPRELLEAK